MAYGPQQRQVIGLATRLSAHDSQRVRRALLEALSVESSFRPLKYGDRDSVGVLQQRPSQGWGPASETPATDIEQFLARARKADRGFSGTAGQLAQAIQRSAFPGRYDAHKSEAIALLGGAAGPAPTAGLGAAPPIADTSNLRHQLAQSLISASQRGSTDLTPALALIRQLRTAQTGSTSAATPVGPIPVELTGRVTKQAVAAIGLAKQYLGTPYVWGGANPKTGFDCSGLVQYAYGQVGVKVPRTSQEQWKHGRPVGRGQLRPGDAVFFEPGPGGPGHEGMYIGGGKFIEAPHTGAVVRVAKLAGRKDYIGARRFS